MAEQCTPEQKEAVETILNSRDFAVGLRGAAGTGKTFVLQEIERGLKAAGRDVVAIAPTMSAVEELEKVGFRNAMTCERLLQDREAQLWIRKKAVILDEAGLVSGRQMAELLKIAEGVGARLIFSGDVRQIQPIEASDALQSTRLWC